MKKHISLVIVFSILLLALTNISPPVKASQDIQETEYLAIDIYGNRSEEHTSELQSRE